MCEARGGLRAPWRDEVSEVNVQMRTIEVPLLWFLLSFYVIATDRAASSAAEQS